MIVGSGKSIKYFYILNKNSKKNLSLIKIIKNFRYRTEGYAAIPLPVLPGLYKFNIPTWRPSGSIINSLRRFFTGGTYELEDITFCSIPKGHEDKILCCNWSNPKFMVSGGADNTVRIFKSKHTVH